MATAATAIVKTIYKNQMIYLIIATRATATAATNFDVKLLEIHVTKLSLATMCDFVFNLDDVVTSVIATATS